MRTGPTTTTVDSPVGPLTLAARDGRLSGIWMHGQRHAPDPADLGVADPRGFAGPAEQLGEWFAGQRTSFDLPLARDAGSAFQQQVWATLTRVPYGTTVTYAELAAAIGRPTAARAVGLANGRNPVCIVVPCHRVVGADGSLTGYAGGLDRKRWLLEHERRVAVRGAAATA